MMLEPPGKRLKENREKVKCYRSGPVAFGCWNANWAVAGGHRCWV
jgi:hypothetical protein